MSKKAGWYPDPWPGHPGQPPMMRYWDGRHWTEHAQPQEAAYAGAAASGGMAYAPSGVSYGVAAPPTTPDGALLSGWWRRFGAYLIDGLIVGVVGGVLSSPWWGDVMDSFRVLFDQAVRDAEAGVQTDTTAFEQEIMSAFLVISLIYVVVGFVYQVGFLMSVQATPGKLLLGLRVRLRDRPELPLSAVLLRWVSQFGYSILNLVPLVGALIWLYWLLDHLWPLWDGKKQALHDKIARTNVVRVR